MRRSRTAAVRLVEGVPRWRSRFRPFADLVFGRQLVEGEAKHQQVGPIVGIPAFGLDALASAAYGPEAALTLLTPFGYAGVRASVPIMAVIVALLTLVYLARPGRRFVYSAGIRRYFARVEHELRADVPLDFAPTDPPIVVVPVEAWNRLAREGLRLGAELSPDVHALHLLTEGTIVS